MFVQQNLYFQICLNLPIGRTSNWRGNWKRGCCQGTCQSGGGSWKKHLSPRKTSNPHLRVWIWSPRCRLIECTHTSTVHLTTCHLLEVSATRPKKTLNLHLAVWIGSQCRSIGGINLLDMYHWIFPSLWCHSGNMKSWIEYWISRQKAVYFCWITSHGELLIKF